MAQQRRVRLSGTGAQKLAGSGIKLKAVKRKRVKPVETEAEARVLDLEEAKSRVYGKKPKAKG